MNKNVIKIGIVVLGLCFSGALAMNSGVSMSQQQQSQQMPEFLQYQQVFNRVIQLGQQIQEMLQSQQKRQFLQFMGQLFQRPQIFQKENLQMLRVLLEIIALILQQQPQEQQQLMQWLLQQQQVPEQQMQLYLQQLPQQQVQQIQQWQQQQQEQLPSFDELQQSIDQYNANQNQTN